MNALMLMLIFLDGWDLDYQPLPVAVQWDTEFREPSVFTPEAATQAKTAGHYAVMFTADWCGPCVSWKNAGNVDRMRNLGTPITLKYEPEIKRNPGWQIKRYPTFRVYSRATGKPVQEWIGSTSPEVISAAVKRFDALEKQPMPIRNSSIYGLRGTSHESRATLINHLANDGIHAGRHSVAELEAMSDDELNELHKRDHGW